MPNAVWPVPDGDFSEALLQASGLASLLCLLVALCASCLSRAIGGVDARAIAARSGRAALLFACAHVSCFLVGESATDTSWALAWIEKPYLLFGAAGLVLIAVLTLRPKPLVLSPSMERRLAEFVAVIAIVHALWATRMSAAATALALAGIVVLGSRAAGRRRASDAPAIGLLGSANPRGTSRRVRSG